MPSIEAIKERTVDPKRGARTFGIVFLLTWVTGIAGRVLLDPVYSEANFVLGDGAGSDLHIQLGAAFEFLLIVANIATAVVLYPIAKRYSEIGAVGYVAARLVECAFILVGLLSLLTIVTLQQNLAGASGVDAASLAVAGQSLTATYEWAFLFGPGLMAGVGNGLILGYVMYRSGLLPRRLAMLGLLGGSVHVIGFLGVLFGAFEAGSLLQLLFTAPEIGWEAALPIYCIWKGFKTTETIPWRPMAQVEPSMATV
jgi:hypothetical protein